MAVIPGTTINLGGKQLVLPPLNLRLYYDFEAERKVVMNPSKHTSEEYTEATEKLLVESLKRNYPDLDVNFMRDNIAVPDCPKYVLALLSNAGFETKSPLEPKTRTD